MPHLSLLKYNAKVNVNHFSRLVVNEDVAAVPVTDSENMADKTGNGYRPGVPLFRCVPRKRAMSESFYEEEAECCGMVSHNLVERLRFVRWRSLLQMLPAKTKTPFARVVAGMCSHATDSVV